MSDVIDFRKPALPKLKPIAEYPRKLKLEPREVTMDSPVVPMLRDSIKAIDAAAEKVAMRTRWRQLIAQGVAAGRETEGENAVDEWLTQCMSKE